MAQKRMFDKTITNSDEFLDMPDSSQNLYFHLSMNADDDGFINNWKSIMRMTGHKDDDLKVLIMKNYILPFDSGVIVIRHWRINNYLRSDRYVETKFKNEKQLLEVDKNLVYQWSTNGVHSIEENSKEEKRIEENSKEENIYDFVEKNFGRGLTPIELQEIDSWKEFHTEEDIKEAIKISCLNNAKKIPYVKAILNNWRINGKEKTKEIPDWMEKDIQTNEATPEEIARLEEMLK